MIKTSKIDISGHNVMFSSAILRNMQSEAFSIFFKKF
jgi:hypothetical protein